MFSREANEKSPVKFTYTAMHGVGYPFTDEAVKQFGFTPVIPVPEQVRNSCGALLENLVLLLLSQSNKALD